MLFSPKRKLLFVHIQKTGGTSVTALLRRNLPDLRRLGAKHSHIDAAIRQFGAARFSRYDTFTFVRNPFDRMVSWFVMKQDALARNPPAMQHHRRKHKENLRSLASGAFAEFLAATTGYQYSHRWRDNQLDYLMDDSGCVRVATIFRFEDFTAACREIGQRWGFAIEKVPHRNAHPHPHYSEYYTDDTRKIVAERCARDIAYFGYAFEDRR
jgi:hypothetical protein